jgi:hypothetical protein
MLFFLIMPLMKFTNLPGWLMPSLLLLLFLLCLITMFYLVLQGVQAIRQRKSKAATPSSSATDSATYGWGNDPATPKRNGCCESFIGEQSFGRVHLVGIRQSEVGTIVVPARRGKRSDCSLVDAPNSGQPFGIRPACFAPAAIAPLRAVEDRQ